MLIIIIGETLPIRKDIYENCLKEKDDTLKHKDPKDIHAHDIPSPIMLSGSKVLSGDGKMIIIAVGKYSAMGKIQSILANEEDVATPL